MLTRIATFTAIGLLAWSMTVTAEEQDDICVLRPDLCNDHVEVSRPAARKTSPGAAQGGARCRVANTAYPLEHADWPICQPAQSHPVTPPQSATARSVQRSPASIPPAVTFESYMAQNARNPAMSGAIPDHQRAFADVKRSATIDFPMDGVSTKENTDPTGAGNNANQAQQSAAGQPVNASAGTGGFSLPAGFDPKSLPANLQPYVQQQPPPVPR